MKCWGISIAGEKKMREVSREIIGENLEAIMTPLSFKLKDGGEEILPAPMACVPNLWAKVEDFLNHHNSQG